MTTTKFSDFTNEIKDEANASGPQAVEELEKVTDHFRNERERLTADQNIKTITLHADGSISASSDLTDEEKMILVRTVCGWDEQTDNQDQILFYTGLKEDDEGNIKSFEE